MREYIYPNQYYFFGTVKELRDLIKDRKQNIMP